MSEYVPIDKNFSLDGKAAIITGGAGGIGYVTAKLFAEKGAKVIIWDYCSDVETIAKSISSDTIGYQLDLSNVDAVREAANIFSDADILCSLAAIAQSLPAETMTVEMWNNHLNINLTGLFFTCQAVGNNMIKNGKGGKIINMASQAAIIALFGHIAYGVSKAGVLAVTRQLAAEWGKHNINVNAISPTVINTPMSDLTTGWWAGERGEKLLETMPSGRFGQPEEVAAAIVFLASDGANLINGANLVIDGGFSIV